MPLDRDALLCAYTQELERMRTEVQTLEPDPAGDYEWLRNATDEAIRRCADKMLHGVMHGPEGDRHDVLKYNPALRRACRTLGIKASAELRAALKARAEEVPKCES
jgi:glycine/D-amino acid oxidase-like deaminating enzyme